MICCKTNNTTVCPKCQHQFSWSTSRRGRQDMSGGGLVATTLSPLPSPEPGSISFIFTPPAALNASQFQQSQPQQVVHVVHHLHHHHHHPPTPLAPPQHQPHLHAHQELPHPDVPKCDIVRALRQSGWYYEGITYQDSQQLLKDKQLGTFIVRDSSDPRFLYSLSVQTERGPTSVRIHYVNGHFRLDSQQHIEALMPAFPSVIELVEHYVEQSNKSKTNAHVWVDPKGKLYSPITITRPLIKEGRKTASLKHLARLAVNAAVKRSSLERAANNKITMPTISQLELPASVSQYLTEYPYSI